MHVLAQCGHIASRRILDAMLFQSPALAARVENDLTATAHAAAHANVMAAVRSEGGGNARQGAGHLERAAIANFLEPPPWGAPKDVFKVWAARVSSDVARRRCHDCMAAKVRASPSLLPFACSMFLMCPAAL
jgi:hypothetical protein